MRKILSRYVLLLVIFDIVFSLPLLAGMSTVSSIALNDVEEIEAIKKSSIIIFYGFNDSNTSKIGLTGNAKVDSLKIENYIQTKRQNEQRLKESPGDSSFGLKNTIKNNYGTTRKKVNAVQKIGEWQSTPEKDTIEDTK